MATIYGIDTGAWRVRIAAMEGSFGRFEIRDAAQVGIEEGPEGAPLHADAIRALRREEPGWEAADKVAAMPLESGVVRSVRLPFTDKNAIAKAVPAEVESQVPWDLEDMVLGTRIVESKDGASRTTVYISRRDDVRERLDLLASAHAEPRLLCIDADALASYSDRGVQVVLDIGHRRTVLALCQNGLLLAARLVPSGGAALTQAVADATGLSFSEAEARKHTMELGTRAGEARAEWVGDGGDESTDPRAAMAAAEGPEHALSEAADAWCADVRAEMIVLEDELKVGIDDLLLCGAGARMAGLGERLAAQTGVPARPVVVPGGHPAEYALAAALARVGAGEVRITDLRTGDFAYHGHAETMLKTMGLIGVGTAVAFAALMTLFVVQYIDTSRRLSELDMKIGEVVTTAFPQVSPERVENPSMAVALMQELTTETTDRVAVLGATLTGVPPTLDMLKALSEGVPSPSEARIDVRELTISAASVSFKADTDSYESAAKIEEALQRQPRFKNARKSDEKKVGEGLSFTMSIPLGEVPASGEEG